MEIPQHLRLLLVASGEWTGEVVERLTPHAVDRVGAVDRATDRFAADRPDCVVLVADAAVLSADSADRSLADAVDAFEGAPVVVVLPPDADVDAEEAIEAGAADALTADDSNLFDRLGNRVECAVAWRRGRDDARGRITEHLKERAMDEAPIGITIADESLPDRPLVYVNDAFETMTGHSREESLGRNCRYLQGPATDADRVAELREAIEASTSASVELVNYRHDGTRFWNKVDVAPVRNESGAVTHYVGFQTDITDRKRAEAAAERYAAEVERERATLQGLVDRIEGLLEDVTRVLVRADSRAALEREVCECVAATEAYASAWIGDCDLTADAVVPKEWVGTDDAAVAGLRVDRSDPDDPTARAAATRSLYVRYDADGRFHAGATLPYRAVAAIPLVHRETLYGVLTVYAHDRFGTHERVVLRTLGRAVGAAIDSFETRRSLVTDSLLELEVSLDDPSLGALASEADCRLSYEGSVVRDDGGTLLYVSSDPADAPVADVAVSGVESVRSLPAVEDGGLFEVRLGEESVLQRVASAGGRLRDLTVDGPTCRLVLAVPDRSTGRSLVDSLEEYARRVEVRALREASSPPQTRRGFVAELETELTDRQRTALQLAHLGGFFEWPHAVSGDELADAMDVSRSTFHQHLRAAQRKLVTNLLD